MADAAGTPRELTEAEIAELLAPRSAWTRADVRRSAAVAFVSSIVFFGALGLLIGRSSGWEAVRQAFFSWPDFQAAFPKVLEGFKLNFKIFMVAEPIILIVGLILAVIRSGRNPVFFPARAAAVAYVDIFRVPGRGVPGGDRVGARQPTGRRAFAWSLERAGVALRGPAAGGAAGDPADAERLRGAAEGDGADLGARALGGDATGANLREPQLQLHELPRGRTHLHRGDDPASALHGLPARPRGGAPDYRGRGVSGPLLQVDGLYKAYDQHLVLRNINLSVKPHEVISLIGASGCGKSTLLRSVNLLEEINAGSIRLNGEPISASLPNANRVRQRIGLVFQSYNLFPHMSVLDNITLAPRQVLGAKRAEAEEAAMVLLERFGLADKAGEYPDRLSGGQQQRVAIVRALALKPDLLLLDEVTSALDPEMVGEVLDIVRELKGIGMTMLLATHQMAFARQISDRVAFLDAGSIVEMGPADRVLRCPEQPRTRQFLQRLLTAAP